MEGAETDCCTAATELRLAIDGTDSKDGTEVCEGTLKPLVALDASDGCELKLGTEAKEVIEFCDCKAATAATESREGIVAVEAIEAMESREDCDAMVVCSEKNSPWATVDRNNPAESERIAATLKSTTPGVLLKLSVND
jgi:hypothetical protein